MSREYLAPPPTLREMSLAADAVVRARVVGSQPADRQNGQRIQTAYQFKISDILHNYGDPIGDERNPLRVLRFGGDRERGGKIVRAYESRFPQFAVGSEFILFLHWNEHEQLWEIMWGPAGLIELTNGRGKAWSKVGPASAANGRDANELIESIKLLRSSAREVK
jgi:hypothetical protein